jgi:hypothetical protein
MAIRALNLKLIGGNLPVILAEITEKKSALQSEKICT